MKINKKAQQEIVGFVLIVVLVMVGLMVFLIISVRDSGNEGESVEASNMLDVLMRSTTDCAIVYYPDYDDFEKLFKSAYKEDSCANLNMSARDYLNESLRDVISSMVRSDGPVGAWEAEFSVRGGEGILKWSEGNCTGNFNGAQRTILSDRISLLVRLRICVI